MNIISDRYNEEHRYYHNKSHIENMLKGLNAYELDSKRHNTLMVAILYHDIIYDPKSSSNEEDSVEYMMNEYDGDNKDYISLLIMFTKYNKSIDEYLKDINLDIYPYIREDLLILTKLDFGVLLNEDGDYMHHEDSIRMEYNHVPSILFKMGRKKVLRKLVRLFGEDLGINKESNISKIINSK